MNVVSRLILPVVAAWIAGSGVSHWAVADIPPIKQRHVFLLIGQSNMAGRAQIEAEDQKKVHGISLWNIESKRWEPAVPPYNRYSPSRKDMSMQRLNCGPSFAKAYLQANPGVEVGIVCAARGGTRIGQWDRENPDKFDLYRHAIEATKLAVQQRGSALKGILWHQGEGNSSTPGGYPARLKELVNRLRADLGVEKLPFVFGQIGQWKPEYAAFNEMIVQQPAKIPHTAVVKTDGLKNFDSAHFDSASQRELGKRYAAEMLKLLKKSSSAKQP